MNKEMNNSVDERISKWQKELEQNPENLEALANLGTLHTGKRDFSKAEEFFRKGSSLVPDDPWFLYHLGYSLHAQGKNEESVPFFEQALEQEPENIQILNTLALVKNLLEKPEEALALLEKTLTIDPENFHIWLNIGNNYYVSKRYDEAEQAYRKAIALNPIYIKAYFNLCRMFELLEREEALRKLVDEAITKFPYSTVFIQALYRLDKIQRYIPAVYTAKVEAQYELGIYRALVVSTVESYGQIKYKYLLYLYEGGQKFPMYYVSLEENNMADLGGGKYFFCAFAESGHVNFGFFNEKPTVKNFTQQAFRKIQSAFNISDDQIPPIDNQS